MKRLCIFLLFLTTVIFISNTSGYSAEAPPAVGETLPEFALPPPSSQAHADYLGVGTDAPVRVPAVKAPVVIIEIFSMYCPYCQAEAPRVNELYHKIGQDPDLKDRIKIIGIGVGNSQFEVDVFRKKYDIPFPLFPDGDYEAYNILGKTRTPFFIVIKNNEDGSHQVVYSKLGAFEGVDEFLEVVLKASGLP